MPRRRLSTQQSRRIRRLQEQRAARVTDPGREHDAQDQLEPEQGGLVLANFGTGVEVEALPPEDGSPAYFCHLRSNLDGLVAGDRVTWQRGRPSGVVVARSPRDSELQRPDRRGRTRTVAANIDRLMLVIAPEPEAHVNLIDRYLVAAAHAGIELSIVLNKIDLLENTGSQQLDALLETYRALGYPVLRASTRIRHGLDLLRQSLYAQTTVFVGQSGVGKSSLIDALLPDQDLRIAPLSAAASKGRHTTTAARLYHLPDGGELIDSPGIREFALLHLDWQDLALGFVEMRPFLGHCQFRDCRHVNEPGCAVRDAVEREVISADRHHSYCHILADNDSA